ncbi:MAG: DUF502 domain-containing protein [Candidatus Marinimicrobia bacterium]|jgi:uncharacterized membrane protein|nr:hypothetical protein [Candidatus Neomarinimicrobiota bacterium]MDP6456267.1 DUF502 domain-containing protein [Candidatus Neomarinimicrobiota bacterium]MDP6593559.1 DUF502 domain-containing protein [Candidatus Neomarinimicrobiota bacterium]MDP6836343.1 DUF502 domain-containing protein [Candidatus Neomarinimicrobiota bacterium]MDP6967058.1 DUF502 domain-containing protein [Candidatus Neomarinimicrobiota bacterium]|tara:strand:+ start:321 stop:929 length:609 start_codon:yes stop_codon:yes gene_type:complete
MAGILKHFRGKFVAALVTIAPVVATFYVIKVLFNFFDGFASPVLDAILPIHIPGLGFIITLLSLYLFGLLITNFLGHQFVNLGENILARIPVANTVYGAAKQITQALSGTRSRAFQKTILIPYPQEHTWTLAFVTGESTNEDGKEFYHVFVSTTPNPTSGFMLIVPKEEAIDAELSVEEGLKSIISGGMLAPKKNKIRTKDK